MCVDCTTPVLTEQQAKDTFEIVRHWLVATVDPNADPKLYPPGHEGPMWVISWEGAGEWAIDFTQASWVADRDLNGVFLEPVFPWCLGLYPAGEGS